MCCQNHGYNKYSGIKLVPTNTGGSWFPSIQQKIDSNKYSGKNRTTRNWFQPIRREIDFNQYREQYFAGNSSNRKRRDIGSKQYSGKLVPTNTAGEAEQQGIDSNQYSGKLVPTNIAGNRFQPIRRENGSDKCSGHGEYMR